MNPRFLQILTMFLGVAAALAVMYFVTKPKAPPANPAPSPKPLVLPDRGFSSEFPEFDMPEFEQLPEEQLVLFELAYTAINDKDTASLNAVIAETPDLPSWTHDGVTLLLLAIQEQNEPAMRALLSAGADVNYSDGMGASPLIDAIAYEWVDAVPILLEAGAGIESPKGVIGQTPLMIAAENGDAVSMQRLLDAGADIDARIEIMHGETALFCAVNASQPASVRFLLDAGIDAAIVNTITGMNAEETALDMYNNDLFEDKLPILEVIEQFEAAPPTMPDPD